MKHQITSTLENLSSSWNVEAEWQPQNSRDSSEWKLCPNISTSLPDERTPKVGLFASRLFYQPPLYFAWEPDPLSQGIDTLQQIWDSQFLYAFPPFCLILQILKKLLVIPTWQSQSGTPFY